MNRNKLTPKGVAWAVLNRLGLNSIANGGIFNAFWAEFDTLLQENGYEIRLKQDAPKKRVKSVPVVDQNKDDFGVILNCAVRYALGRRTYMPSLVIGFITPRLKHLSTKTLWCLDKDVTDARYTGGYGDPCDEADWMRFLAAVHAERSLRGQEPYHSHWEDIRGNA